MFDARQTVKATQSEVREAAMNKLGRRYNLAHMDGGIRERVEALRREIAEIQKLNLAYSQMPRPDFIAMNDRVRREQRLKEIMDELKSMTDWKKP